MAEAHRVGVTSVHSSYPTVEEMELLDEIRRQGDLAIRVYGSISMPATITEADVSKLDTLRDRYPDDPKLKLGGVELACSNALPSECQPETLERAIALFEGHDWQIIVRTPEGAELPGVLDVLERASAPAARSRRHRLDGRVLADENARLLLGSGWPEASLDPFDTIEEAVAASTDLELAIDAYTSHPAYASYDEHRKGTLAPGMLADIVVLSNDIFDGRPESLRETVVTVTILDGEIVYQRPAASSDD
jgi:predicted amidohydrolase YtcJ